MADKQPPESSDHAQGNGKKNKGNRKSSPPDKGPGELARRGGSSKPLTIQQEKRRREAVHLRLQGYGHAEIAKKLGVDRKTVVSDLEAVERRYREASQQDWKTIRAREVAILTELRAMAIDAYKSNVNRHGETHLTGYLHSALQASKQIAELQHLTNPATAISIGGGGDNQRVNLQFVTVKDREELEEIQRLEQLSAERYKSLLEQTIATQSLTE